MTQFKSSEARVLIVEDTIANITLLTTMLGRIGYRNVHSITDPRETVRQVETFKPDLIILDLMMPHMDGFQVMEQLRGVIPEQTYLPILVLTADASPASKRKALASGAHDFLLKPFDASEIFIRIRNLIQTRFFHLALQDQNPSPEHAVAELSAAIEQLKQSHQVKLQQERLRAFGEMAEVLVRDFNNALMSVLGYSELILQEPALLDDKPAVLNYFKTMNTVGCEAAHLVGRLREFYRPREAADVFEPLNLNQVIEETVVLTRPKWADEALADGRAIQVKLELEKTPAIIGNRAELRELFAHLILNSVEAMPQGGVITARTWQEADRVAFEFADTGVGMSEEVRTHCLEPFFSTKGDKGAGLGLSMVFGGIKRHEAELQVESQAGEGTTVRVFFPSQIKTSQNGRLIIADRALPKANGQRAPESTRPDPSEPPLRMMDGHADMSRLLGQKIQIDLLLPKPVPQPNPKREQEAVLGR
jgi:signal transduction histidine kinase